jgi:hypothetical protein
MFVNNKAFRTVPLLFLAACGPKSPADEHDDQSPDELLADACESFCERAVSCPPGEYAELLDFQDEQTCTSQCLKFHADVPSDPPEECLLIRADLWSCAGALEDCALFEAFDVTSFGTPHPLGNPCLDELDKFLHKCNG